MKVFARYVRLLIISFIILPLVGCSDDDDVSQPPPVSLTEISVSPSTVSDPLPVGVAYQFTATGTYSDGSKQDLTSSATWNSSDTGVATVDANGLATGAAAGTSNISASLSGVTSNATALTVANPTLLSITVTPTSIPNALPVGRATNFKAEGLFDNDQTYDITNYVIWDSSVPGVASIDQTGEATALTAGTTNISASTATPALTSNAVVLRVADLTQDTVFIEPTAYPNLPLGRAQKLFAFLIYSDGTLLNITNTANWTSADTSIAKVTNAIGGTINGTVVGVAVGETQITATDNNTGLAATVTISVVEEEITGVIIKPAGPVDIPLLLTQAYIAEGTFSDGINRQLGDFRAWELSDTSIGTFTFTSTGFLAKVQGVGTGSVDVIYDDVLADGSATGMSARSTLNVTPPVLNSIAITPDLDFSLPVYATQIFYATGIYNNGTRKLITEDVTWVSQSPDVAAFGPETGLLRGLVVTAPPGTGVYATLEGVSSATINVDVNNSTLQSITIGPTMPAQVAVGATNQLTARGEYDTTPVSYFDIATEVNWESSDTAIVTVSNIEGEKGVITGVSPGFAEITVTDPRTALTDTETVVVLP